MSDYDIDDEEIYEEEIISSDEEFDNETVASDDGIEINKFSGDDIIPIDDELTDEFNEADELNENEELPDDDKIIIDKKMNKKTKNNLKEHFLDPSIINKNVVLERSNKPRTIIIVANEDRNTSDHLQKAERAGLIAVRAKQIANDGAPEYLNDIV